jgi:hypothetical protein
MGLPAAAIWSMMPSAVAVLRSEGELSSVALARQWMQRRLQPLVTSQKISLGEVLTSAASPLPCAMVLSFSR